MNVEGVWARGPNLSLPFGGGPRGGVGVICEPRELKMMSAGASLDGARSPRPATTGPPSFHTLGPTPAASPLPGQRETPKIRSRSHWLVGFRRVGFTYSMAFNRQHGFECRTSTGGTPHSEMGAVGPGGRRGSSNGGTWGHDSWIQGRPAQPPRHEGFFRAPTARRCKRLLLGNVGVVC